MKNYNYKWYFGLSNSFISPAQCRMARALLQWSQPDLAERCGLATMTISKFEKDEGGKPEARTISKIAAVFEMAGVAFSNDGGVKPIQNLITILEGQDANYRVLEDIWHRLKDTGGEVLIAGLREFDPGENPQGHDFVKAHVNRLKENGITERMLLEDGDTNLLAPPEWYRYLPKDKFSDTPFQLYGDRIAMIDFGPPQKIVVVEHPRFANTFRNLFDLVWEDAKPVEVDGGI